MVIWAVLRINGWVQVLLANVPGEQVAATCWPPLRLFPSHFRKEEKGCNEVR